MTRVLEFKKMYSVLDSEQEHVSPIFGTMPKSFTIVEVWDHSTGKLHYARWIGNGNHGMDYLPGGSLYLGDTWVEALHAIGVHDDVAEPMLS